MTLLNILSVNSDHDHPVSKYFWTDKRQHFTIKAVATDIQFEGEMKDSNGVVWSVSFDQEQEYNEFTKAVTLTSVRPLNELKIETEYI